MNFLVLGIVLVVAAPVVALLANYFQKGYHEPLRKMHALDNLCSLHKWKKFKFLQASELEAYRQNPEKFPEINYCDDCGYVPVHRKILKPKYREYFRKQEIEEDFMVQR